MARLRAQATLIQVRIWPALAVLSYTYLSCLRVWWRELLVDKRCGERGEDRRLQRDAARHVRHEGAHEPLDLVPSRRT